MTATSRVYARSGAHRKNLKLSWPWEVKRREKEEREQRRQEGLAKRLEAHGLFLNFAAQIVAEDEVFARRLIALADYKHSVGQNSVRFARWASIHRDQVVWPQRILKEFPYPTTRRYRSEARECNNIID